jgi:lysophospholipase L1-like esterase
MLKAGLRPASLLLSLVPLFLFPVVAPGSPSELRVKKGDRIVALGDSITQAGGYLELMRGVFQKHYPGLGIEVLNAGISGHKSPDMLARLQKDVIDKNPTIVTISCGVNDVWHGFQNPPRGVDLTTYRRLMGEIVDGLRSQTKAEIYLLTPTIIHEDLESPENRQLEEYCQAVRQIAEERRCRLVDLNDLFNLVVRSTQIGGAPYYHPTSDGVHMRSSGDFLMGAAILRELGVPLSAVLEVTRPPAVQVSAADPRLQLWGRWDLRKADTVGAITVNTGSTIIARFEGPGLTLHFQTSQYPQQFPTLWLQIDESDWKEVSPREALPISLAPLSPGEHMARVVVKGFREWERRWEPPLETSIVFRGVSLQSGAKLLETPPRPTRLIEYLGDSITEGVLVRNTGPRESWKPEKWPHYSDGRSTWAYQSALLVGAEPRTVGFGRLGLTVNGNGGVPPAIYSFASIYSGVPIDGRRLPDAVVINLGTNDGGAKPEVFSALYRAYLEVVRRQYGLAHIFCLRPFNGAQGEAVREVAKALASGGDGRIHYVDTAGWIDREKHTTDGVHLNLEGNRLAGEKMAAILKENR